MVEICIKHDYTIKVIANNLKCQRHFPYVSFSVVYLYVWCMCVSVCLWEHIPPLCVFDCAPTIRVRNVVDLIHLVSSIILVWNGNTVNGIKELRWYTDVRFFFFFGSTKSATLIILWSSEILLFFILLLMRGKKYGIR